MFFVEGCGKASRCSFSGVGNHLQFFDKNNLATSIKRFAATSYSHAFTHTDHSRQKWSSQHNHKVQNLLSPKITTKITLFVERKSKISSAATHVYQQSRGLQVPYLPTDRDSTNSKPGFRQKSHLLFQKRVFFTCFALQRTLWDVLRQMVRTHGRPCSSGVQQVLIFPLEMPIAKVHIYGRQYFHE